MYFRRVTGSETPFEYYLPMAMIDMQPQELQLALQGLAAGDRFALLKIFLHYRGQIYRFSRIRLRSDADAEEVTQEVFLDLHYKPISFNSQSKFSSYLCGMARNKAVDLIRKKSNADKYPHVDIDDESEYVEIPDESRSSNPELSMEDRQTDARYRKCLDKLPDAQKSVFTMDYVEELTETEIANVVGCAIGTVKSRLSAARASMQKCLGPWRQEVRSA
jgi:RNA polymerase sigma-70 factor (ECF subfamily)